MATAKQNNVFTPEYIEAAAKLAVSDPISFQMIAVVMPEEVRAEVQDLASRQAEISSFAESFAPKIHEAQRATEVATETHRVLFNLGETITTLVPSTTEKRGGGNKKKFVLSDVDTPAGKLTVIVKPE